MFEYQHLLLLASLPACQLASLPACQLASLPACQPANLPTCQLASLPTCQPASLPTCQPANLPTCQPASLSLTNAVTFFQVGFIQLRQRGLQVQICGLYQGILKGEVSLYCWPPFLLFYIFIFSKKKKKLSVVVQQIPNQSNRRSTVQWYFPL